LFLFDMDYDGIDDPARDRQRRQGGESCRDA
jgi:hypothetical protein